MGRRGRGHRIPSPPLRARSGDVTLLAQYFLDKLNKETGASKRLTPAALERLERHDWPGNVRELKNAIERAHIVAADRIDSDSLPSRCLVPAATEPTSVPPFGSSIAKVEQELILATMERCRGDKKRAAEILGISLKTLYTKLNSYRDAENPAGPPDSDASRAQEGD